MPKIQCVYGTRRPDAVNALNFGTAPVAVRPRTNRVDTPSRRGVSIAHIARPDLHYLLASRPRPRWVEAAVIRTRPSPWQVLDSMGTNSSELVNHGLQSLLSQESQSSLT